MIQFYRVFLCAILVLTTTVSANAARTNTNHVSYFEKLRQEYSYIEQRKHALKNLITQYDSKFKAAVANGSSRISFYEQKLSHAKHMHHKLLEHQKVIAEAEREVFEEEDFDEDEASLDPMPEGLDLVAREEALLDADGL